MRGLEQQVCSARTHLAVREVCVSISSSHAWLWAWACQEHGTPPRATLTSHRPQTERLEPIPLFS